MSKKWKTFEFAPSAILEPKRSSGVVLENVVGSAILRYFTAGEWLDRLSQKVFERAGRYEVIRTANVEGNTRSVKFAVGLCYKLCAPIREAQVEYGFGWASGLVLAGLTAERNKIKNIIDSVFARFAPAYVSAWQTLRGIDITNGGGISSSSTSTSSSTTNANSSSTRIDKFAQGAAVVSANTSGRTETTGTDGGTASGTASTTGTSKQETDFLRTRDALDIITNGEIPAIEDAIIDALFENLFEEVEHPNELRFGDIRGSIWESGAL